jgi:hypothetical protein
MTPKIKVIREGEFRITYSSDFFIDYKFLSHGENCSVFSVPKKHVSSVKFCPMCGAAIMPKAEK